MGRLAVTQVSLGIDVGTTSVKVCALDEAGAVAATASSQHGIDAVADGVQVEPDVWWRSVVRALAELAGRVDLSRVAAVGMSGNMSSVVLVGADGDPLGPALLLADGRGGEQIAALPPDVRAAIARATGNAPQTVFSLSSLLWWRAAAPDTLGRATAWLSAKDEVRRRLTGEVATDPTDAYNSLLLTAGGWDERLVESVGLERRLFPPVLPSAAVAGAVSAGAAAATGIPAGTPVATGSGDVAAALTGMGGLPDGVLAVSLGTSVTLMAGLGGGERPPLPAAASGALTVHPTADGSWFALGSLLTGGLAVNWLRSLLGTDAIAVAPSPLDADVELQFLPYLAGTGSPDYVPAATGTILGITPSTTAPQIAAALLESVAFDLADLVDRLGADRWTRVVVSGGGRHIDAWPQILADVLGLPVDVVEDSDLSALGAAVHGWRAAGRAVARALTARSVAPRQDTRQTWEERRRRHTVARAASLDLSSTLLSGERKATHDPHRHR